MGRLQDLFEKTARETFTMEKMLQPTLKLCFARQGITPTDEQLAASATRFWEALGAGDEKLGKIDLSDIFPREDSQKDLSIDFGEDDLKSFQADIENMPKMIESAAANSIETLSNMMREGLKKTAPAMLQDRRDEERQFAEIIAHDWGQSIDLLEMLVVICLECGEDVYAEDQEQHKILENLESSAFEVLCHLHARACQIAQEILLLMRAGFADGAHARSRTLYEVMIVALFIAERGDEVASRYVFHGDIEARKAAIEFRKHHARLGLEDVPDKEFDDIEKTYQSLIKRFGKPYSNSYGWAADSLHKDNPTFSDIEKSISFEFMRPSYKMASHNVHANPQGILLRLGLWESGESGILLAGPSNEGMFYPGMETARAITRLTAELLNTKNNMDNTVMVCVLTELCAECEDSFAADSERLIGAQENLMDGDEPDTSE